MRGRKEIRRFFMFALLLSFSVAHADDNVEIKTLIKNLYGENEKALQCRGNDGAIQPGLIKMPLKYFSKDFIQHYRAFCVGQGFIGFDIRSGEQGIYLYKDSTATISNLHIGQPNISGMRAVVRATYDLEVASFKDWGNFSKYQMVKEQDRWRIDDIELGGVGEERESITALENIKSMKQYLAKKEKAEK